MKTDNTPDMPDSHPPATESRTVSGRMKRLVSLNYFTMTNEEGAPPKEVQDTKQFRKDLDAVLQTIKAKSERDPDCDAVRGFRSSPERSNAIMKLQEAIMWLGMDLKALNEPNPYPQSYNPDSSDIEPTADGLKL